MKARVFCGACLLLSPLGGTVQAATCTVSTVGLAFGNYDPTSTTALTMIGTGTLNCTFLLTGVSATVTLSAGSSGIFNQRTMLLASQILVYNLYADAGHTQVFGDGTAGTSSFTGCYAGVTVSCPGGGAASGTSYSVPVYGLVRAGQNLSAGTFEDTITLTVTY